MPKAQWYKNWTVPTLESTLPQPFGAFIGGHSVEIAFEATLEKWLPTYIAEMNRQIGSRVLTAPIIGGTRPEYRTSPRERTAQIVIEVPHTIGTPMIVSQDHYRASWRVECMIYIFGTKDPLETMALTEAYTTVIRQLVMQQRGLEGFAETTRWEGEEYAEGEHVAGRTTGLGHIRFAVVVGNAGALFGGPPLPGKAPTGAKTGPSTTPAAIPPEATSTTVTVQGE